MKPGTLRFYEQYRIPILEQYESGVSQLELAKKNGVSPSTIQRRLNLARTHRELLKENWHKDTPIKIIKLLKKHGYSPKNITSETLPDIAKINRIADHSLAILRKHYIK